MAGQCPFEAVLRTRLLSTLSHRQGPVSSLAPLSLDTVTVGLVSSLVVYPVYLAILFLFRMSRSKVGAWGS